MGIQGLGEVSERVRRGTVLVQPGGRGAGSGVVWSGDGTIMTNAHVARAGRVQVTLWDGREFSADVVGRDDRRDLAALRISATGLNALEAGDSARVRAGEIAIAVGNPLGFLGALTTGVVHAVGPIRGAGGQRWVQSDVRLAPGNSGGPLCDARGRVIGINTMIAGRLALAIPSNDVVQFLKNGGRQESRTWMGVRVAAVRLPRGNGRVLGLLIVGLDTGGAAENASLMLGDILLGTGDAAFDSVQDLGEAIQKAAGGVLRLDFLRGDYEKVRRVSVQLAPDGRRGGSLAA
jgi:serine protease Do